MNDIKHWTFEGRTLSGVERGQGELVLLLHGFPAYHKTWEHYMEPLSEQWRVVAVDLRGYFESSKPEGVSSYSMRLLVEDLVGLVRHLGYDKVKVVGHDWGGALAWAFASWHPELVSSLVVYNCAHPAIMSRHLRRNRRQLRRSWYILFFQLPWLPEGLIRRFPDAFLRRCFRSRRGTFSQDDMLEYKEAFLRPGVVVAAVNYYRAALRESRRKPVYPPIECPVLLLWGEKDAALGVELTEGTERYVSGSYQLRGFPENGHWSPNELVEETVPILRDFLGASAV
jgi:pimeloyl-ACP methyl ester carboxylesterase